MQRDMSMAHGLWPHVGTEPAYDALHAAAHASVHPQYRERDREREREYREREREYRERRSPHCSPRLCTSQDDAERYHRGVDKDAYGMSGTHETSTMHRHGHSHSHRHRHRHRHMRRKASSMFGDRWWWRGGETSKTSVELPAPTKKEISTSK